jgi:hypothetical protein
MKLPKLMINKGRYQGMRGCNEVYGADYYLVADVNKYKKKAEDLLTYAKEMEEALKQLISIVEIHSKASKNNFAWAELDFANEVLGNT